MHRRPSPWPRPRGYPGSLLAEFERLRGAVRTDERQARPERIDADIEAQLDRNIGSRYRALQRRVRFQEDRMRGGGSNDEKSRGHGQQNECAKISTTWVHDFSLRPEWRKAP